MRDWSGNRIPMYRVTACASEATPSFRRPSGCEGLVVAFAVPRFAMGTTHLVLLRSARHSRR
jgi:hypothetical protein